MCVVNFQVVDRSLPRFMSLFGWFLKDHLEGLTMTSVCDVFMGQMNLANPVNDPDIIFSRMDPFES